MTQKPTLDDLERWFLTSWEPPNGSAFVSLADYASEKLPPESRSLSLSWDEPFGYKVLKQIGMRLQKCPAKCPKQLRQWCYREIDKIAAKLNKDRGGKKPLVYEQHGSRVFINLADSKGKQHIWIIPADWLEWAIRLNPYVRYYPDGRPYVARKVAIVQPDGTSKQKEVAVHRLFMGLRAVIRRKSDAAPVRAKDGNWLNFCDGNLEIAKGRDLLDVCSYFENPDEAFTSEPEEIPHQPTAVHTEDETNPGLHRHERSVMQWLGGPYLDNTPIPDEIFAEEEKNFIET